MPEHLGVCPAKSEAGRREVRAYCPTSWLRPLTPWPLGSLGRGPGSGPGFSDNPPPPTGPGQLVPGATPHRRAHKGRRRTGLPRQTVSTRADVFPARQHAHPGPRAPAGESTRNPHYGHFPFLQPWVLSGPLLKDMGLRSLLSSSQAFPDALRSKTKPVLACVSSALKEKGLSLAGGSWVPPQASLYQGLPQPAEVCRSRVRPVTRNSLP